MRHVGPDEQALITYWRMQDLWGLINILALMVAESDAILSYLQW
jgi:hypothetical protein